jgi:hypothetical protein
VSDDDLINAVEDVLAHDADGCTVHLTFCEAAEVCGAIREEVYRLSKSGKAANSVKDLREVLSRIDLLMGGDGDVDRMLAERAEWDATGTGTEREEKGDA